MGPAPVLLTSRRSCRCHLELHHKACRKLTQFRRCYGCGALLLLLCFMPLLPLPSPWSMLCCATYADQGGILLHFSSFSDTQTFAVSLNTPYTRLLRLVAQHQQSDTNRPTVEASRLHPKASALSMAGREPRLLPPSSVTGEQGIKRGGFRCCGYSRLAWVLPTWNSTANARRLLGRGDQDPSLLHISTPYSVISGACLLLVGTE